MKINILRRSLLAILLCASFTVFLNAQVQSSQIQIPQISTAPIIDGKLNDPVWQRGTELTEFINWALNTYISDPVTVYICYDDKNLYVAFRNSDPVAADLNKTVSPKGPRDTFLWGRNHALISIKNKENSIQLIADPKGTMTDMRNGDISWNGNWQYAASINQTDWTGEFSIPMADIGLDGTSAGNEIQLSVSRSYPKGESSNWSGACILAGQETPHFSYGRWTDPVPGTNLMSFTADNQGQTPVSLQCELELIPLNEIPEFLNQQGQGASSDMQLKVSSEPLYYRNNYTIPAGGKISDNIQYILPHEGSYYGTVTVRSKDGSVLRRSTGFWFTLEENRKNLDALKHKIGESIATMTRVSNPVANDLKAEAESLLSEVSDLQKNTEDAWKSGKWNELTGKVKNLDLKISRNLHEVRWAELHNWKNNSDFGVALANSAIKLRKDSIFPLPLNDIMEMSLARNEYESIQLALLPFGKDMNNLSVNVSDLKDANGNTITKNNIELSLVDYNNIEWQSDYVTSRRGWFPDPLIPLKQGIKISAEDLCRPIWITVFAPAGTKAGEYSGTITVNADGMKGVTAIVKCRVWDIDLPVVSHLKTHSWDEIEFFADFNNLDEYPVEKYQQFCALLLKNRFNPGSAGVNYVSMVPGKKGKYDFSKVEQVLGYAIERGLTRFSIVQMKKGLYTPEEEKKVYKFIEAYAKFLREKGWLDKALVELWDEPTDLEWPYIKERAEKLKKIDPGLRLQLFAEGGPYDFYDRSTDKYGLNNLVDIWAPVNIIESPETQAKGGEIWTYFCTLARESAPNFFIDCPAIYQRSIAWYCWMYGVDGFEHWSTNYFWRNVKKGQPMDQKWPNVPWDSRTYYYFNGEGQLVYPGADGATYSSIRLENFREGMDDYEYLYKLRELLSAFRDDTNDPKLNEYRQLLNPENYLLIKYPRKIKVTLENTIRHTDQPELFLETRNKVALAIEDLQKRK